MDIDFDAQQNCAQINTDNKHAKANILKNDETVGEEHEYINTYVGSDNPAFQTK